MELQGTDFADLSSFLCLKWILGGDWKVTSSFHPLSILLAKEELYNLRANCKLQTVFNCAHCERELRGEQNENL